MTKTFLTESQINASTPTSGKMSNLARTLTAPMPQVFLVTRDPELGEAGVCVRTATLCPLSWGPYTKSVTIPLGDTKVARNLKEGGQCVLGLPSRRMLRQLAICRQRLPQGISEAAVARLKLVKSQAVDVPSLQECPVNFECVIDHIETYHDHLVSFVRVVAASIDETYALWERERIIQEYPTNFADEIYDAEHGLRMRVSLLRDIHPCPQFPVGQKAGWGDSFDKWMRDLADERYVSAAERAQVREWHRRWQAIFKDTQSAERAALKKRLQEVCRLAANEQWPKLHEFLAASRTEG